MQIHENKKELSIEMTFGTKEKDVFKAMLGIAKDLQKASSRRFEMKKRIEKILNEYYTP